MLTDLFVKRLALPTVALIAVWKGVGLNMITYLGALQNVPTELDEAAQIDGANKWQRIKNVVIPMISPTTFFLIISSIITSLQNFTVIQSLTEGGPGQSTTVMALSIVRTALHCICKCSGYGNLLDCNGYYTYSMAWTEKMS